MEKSKAVELEITIPYFAPEVPAPLPTISEIVTSKVFTTGPGGDWKIATVGDYFTVKYGKAEHLSLIEWEHMMFIGQATNSRIKVPTVYALYTDIGGKYPRNFIVMERIKGVSLDTLWPSLAETEKQAIASRLKGYFIELRRIPAPDYYGSIRKQPILVRFESASESELAINGSFDSEDDFNKAVARGLVEPTSDRSAVTLQLYTRLVNAVLKNHPPCFTHGDFQLKNIIVEGLVAGEDRSLDEIRERGFEVTLVNWQNSGWLPTYWEYISATVDVNFEDEWHLWIASIVPTFEAEFCLFQTWYGAA